MRTFDSERCQLSRRALLRRGGLIAAGAAAAGALLRPMLGAVAEAKARKAPLAVPWPYEKVDPLRAARIAYERYAEGACCYAVSSAVLLQLQERVGDPYRSVPLYDALRLGRGGVDGWGTTCGALLGSMVVVGLAAPVAIGKQIMNELMQWYCDASLPQFVPEAPKVAIRTSTRAQSPLCHVSVLKWCKEEAKPFGSPEQVERCWRLSADVAARTVSLLNDWKDGKFRSTLKTPPEIFGFTTQPNCSECHSGAARSRAR